MISSICVFCGSGPGLDPQYMTAAHTLGQSMAKAGIRLVYGGGSTGLMGEIARSVMAHGGNVTGVIPEFLVQKEVMLDGADEMIVTKNMHERKMIMFERAECFVAMPGGVGTLEELIEQMTWAQLGQHNKPILLANIANFWTPLLELIEHMQSQKFIREGLEVGFLVANEIEDVIPSLNNYLAAHNITPSSMVEKM